MRYEDYLRRLATLAVELANTGSVAHLSPISRELLTGHGVAVPTGADAGLGKLLALLRPAVAAVADGDDLAPLEALLRRHPPELHVDGHGGPAHLHYARAGAALESWIGQSCAAALAHVACGDPAVIVGRCAAAGCGRHFVDGSRNRSRRFCGNACASRTTVAAYRARGRGRPDEPA